MKFIKNKNSLALYALSYVLICACSSFHSSTKHASMKTVNVNPMISEVDAGLIDNIEYNQNADTFIPHPSLYDAQSLAASHSLVSPQNDNQKLKTPYREEFLPTQSPELSAVPSINLTRSQNKKPQNQPKAVLKIDAQEKSKLFAKRPLIEETQAPVKTKKQINLAKAIENSLKKDSKSLTLEKNNKEKQPLKTKSESTYLVKKGDSLWKISQNLYDSGLKWQELFEHNRQSIQDPHQIMAGTLLVLPFKNSKQKYLVETQERAKQAKKSKALTKEEPKSGKLPASLLRKNELKHHPTKDVLSSSQQLESKPSAGAHQRDLASMTKHSSFKKRPVNTKALYFFLLVGVLSGAIIALTLFKSRSH